MRQNDSEHSDRPSRLHVRLLLLFAIAAAAAAYWLGPTSPVQRVASVQDVKVAAHPATQWVERVTLPAASADSFDPSVPRAASVTFNDDTSQDPPSTF